jgi:hypothetical protein
MITPSLRRSYLIPYFHLTLPGRNERTTLKGAPDLG